MNAKRYFRGPFFWVALVIIAVLLATSLSSAAGGFKEVDTTKAIEAIESGQVAKAELVDRDQRIELTLVEGAEVEESNKIQADYVTARQRQLVRMLEDNPPTRGFTDSVPRATLNPLTRAITAGFPWAQSCA